MRFLIIGAGGIGSHLVRGVYKLILNEQIDSTTHDFTVADNDIVELEQTWQAYEPKDVGLFKSRTLCKDSEEIISANINRIESEHDLIKYDFFILAVDNNQTRRLVMNYCYRTGKEFIDLRADDNKAFALPKLTEDEVLKFMDDDKKEYSCLSELSKKKGWQHLGNQMAANIGLQMILNHLRGIRNRTANVII